MKKKMDYIHMSPLYELNYFVFYIVRLYNCIKLRRAHK